ncbi:MAG TPA: hypothetical protein VFU49_15915 [Ktedonobacteraceae bacterium]|nr:hypothetical protein [Ktedonobacteraceae bacterium]
MFTGKEFRDVYAYSRKKGRGYTLGYWIQRGFIGVAIGLCLWLLAGCDASISLSVGTPASKIAMMTVPLTAMKQVYICDKTGNVTLSASSQAKDVTVEVKKTVYVQKSADPAPLFQALTVSTQNITSSSCDWLPKKGDGSTLVVSATSPDDGELLKDHKNTIHLNIVFPSSMIADGSPLSVRIEAGNNITLSGFAGSLTLLSTAGDVQAEHMSLVSNSMLHAQAGNIVFKGSLSGSKIQDVFQSDSGDVSLTLPATTNVSVDANAPTGNIEDTFSPNSVNQGVAGASVKGPLNPAMNNITPGLLKLMSSTGDIVINKA